MPEVVKKFYISPIHLMKNKCLLIFLSGLQYCPGVTQALLLDFWSFIESNYYDNSTYGTALWYKTRQKKKINALQYC